MEEQIALPEKAKIEAIDIHKNSLLQQKQNQDNQRSKDGDC